MNKMQSFVILSKWSNTMTTVFSWFNAIFVALTGTVCLWMVYFVNKTFISTCQTHVNSTGHQSTQWINEEAVMEKLVIFHSIFAPRTQCFTPSGGNVYLFPQSRTRCCVCMESLHQNCTSGGVRGWEAGFDFPIKRVASTHMATVLLYTRNNRPSSECYS